MLHEEKEPYGSQFISYILICIDSLNSKLQLSVDTIVNINNVLIMRIKQLNRIEFFVSAQLSETLFTGTENILYSGITLLPPYEVTRNTIIRSVDCVSADIVIKTTGELVIKNLNKQLGKGVFILFTISWYEE